MTAALFKQPGWERFNAVLHYHYPSNIGTCNWFVNSSQSALDGFRAQVALLPDANAGVVVLTNSETPLQAFLYYKVFDVFTGAPPRDWSADYRARVKAAREREAAGLKRFVDSLGPGTVLDFTNERALYFPDFIPS